MVVEAQFPQVTAEALAKLRARIGSPVPRVRPHIEEATVDTIRHWAMGIGDKNPLWLDPQYAEQSVHRTILAPPTILYAMDKVVGGYVGGLPGIHAMFAGTDWHWNRPIRYGDRIRGEAVLKDVVERRGRFAGTSVQQIYEVHFFDQNEEEVAWADSWCFRTERDTARERAKYRSDHFERMSAEELHQIAQLYEAERIRGGKKRAFSSVRVGDDVDGIVRGPYTPTMAIAFVQGWGGLYIYAHGYALDLFERHPATAIPNRQGVPEPPERVHWDAEMARAVGVPAPYDYGPERVSWLGTLITNWMGDAGFLRRLRVELRRHNMCGDTIFCKGRVIDLQALPSGGGIVGIDIEARNQREQISAVGYAEVQLPG